MMDHGICPSAPLASTQQLSQCQLQYRGPPLHVVRGCVTSKTSLLVRSQDLQVFREATREPTRRIPSFASPSAGRPNRGAAAFHRARHRLLDGPCPANNVHLLRQVRPAPAPPLPSPLLGGLLVSDGVFGTPRLRAAPVPREPLPVDAVRTQEPGQNARVSRPGEPQRVHEVLPGHRRIVREARSRDVRHKMGRLPEAGQVNA